MRGSVSGPAPAGRADHSSASVPTGKSPDGAGKFGTGNAHTDTGPAAISAAHTTEPGTASHHRARHGVRPERRATIGASRKAPTTAAATTTGTSCQRSPVMTRTVTDPASNAPAASAAGPRSRSGSQRAATRTRAPSTVRASGADNGSPAVGSVMRISSGRPAARRIALTSQPCAT
ncbi:hypothetical protein ACFYUH_00215 [Streptomyces fimicarius]|uniref:hypothetical protein n=1 Tax=Streptomyces griseus TaxID=1911 RepID=UPI0036829E39